VEPHRIPSGERLGMAWGRPYCATIQREAGDVLIDAPASIHQMIGNAPSAVTSSLSPDAQCLIAFSPKARATPGAAASPVNLIRSPPNAPTLRGLKGADAPVQSRCAAHPLPVAIRSSGGSGRHYPVQRARLSAATTSRKSRPDATGAFACGYSPAPMSNCRRTIGRSALKRFLSPTHSR